MHVGSVWVPLLIIFLSAESSGPHRNISTHTAHGWEGTITPRVGCEQLSYYFCVQVITAPLQRVKHSSVVLKKQYSMILHKEMTPFGEILGVLLTIFLWTDSSGRNAYEACVC